jgi:hypothetical protein
LKDLNDITVIVGPLAKSRRTFNLLTANLSWKSARSNVTWLLTASKRIEAQAGRPIHSPAQPVGQVPDLPSENCPFDAINGWT